MGFTAEKKVGLVFFAGICLLFIFTLILTDIRVFKKYYGIDVLFNSVGGLEKGNKVTIGGMEVGDVKDLILEHNRVRVRLAIRTTSRIPRSSTFRVSDVGLLGGKRVDISWGEATEAYFRPGEEIIGIDTPGLSEAIASLGESGKKVEDILNSTRDIADRIARGEGTVGKLIKEEAIYDELKEAAPKLKNTLANLEEITGKISQGEGTIGKLVNDPKFYNEARETLSSLKTASQKLTDLAARAERVQFYIGGETSYNIDTRRYLSKAYLQIEPTSSKLYQVGFSLLSGPGTEAEKKDEPDTELDAQIGLRFFSDRLTLRAGLLEGRLGGGTDFRIWGERLVATVEGRNVWTKEKDEGIRPFLLRARLNLDLFWGFYLYVGGDNLLDRPGFNFGGGLKLRDDDVKALFGVVTLSQ